MTALADRVKESTTTTGTGSLTLSGAVAQFESFNTAFGTAAPFYYVITDANGTDWEVGTGELSNATTLVRTTVHQSSNADAKINLSAGTHTVFCSAPAVFLADLASKSGKLSQFAATTSAELAGVISDETGSGALVFATSPTLTTPNIGVATATSVNGTTIPSSKTLVVTTDKLSALAATTSAELAGVISDETGTGSLVFASSPSLTTPDIGAATATSVNGTTIPSSKTLVVTTDKLSALAATTSAELAGVISDETGSGSLVFATSPSLTTPNIGTPSAGTLTNCTGLPVGGVSGLGTGVGTALTVNTGSAGAFVVNGGALGTPSSGTLTNATGLPVSTGVSGLGSGVATALAVNTGSSGAVVVNGGALGTPSSGTVTNLTGTASININGTVGATTANTGAFTTLSATGVATFSAGTAAAPAITTSGDTNNGIYFPAADNLAITTGGTQRVLVDSSGNVGIGTSAPTAKLDVVTSANLGANYLNLAYDTGGGSGWIGGYNVTYNSGVKNVATGALNAIWYNSDSVRVYTNSSAAAGTTASERMRIDSSGNVGIGTSAPGSLLHLSSGSTTVQRVEATSTNAAYITYKNNSADRLYVGTENSTGAGIIGTGAAYAGVVSTASTNPLVFGTNNAERMRLDTSGNLLLGTTSTNSYNVTGAHIYGSGNAPLLLRHTGATSGRRWEVGPGSDNVFIIYNQDGSGVYLTNGGTSWNANSDERIKDIIEPISNAAEKVCSLRAVIGKYKKDEDGVRRSFLIAQDVQKVLPEAVNAQNDEIGTLGLAYTDTIPLLVAAIQEQQQQIDALKAEVATLKGNA